MIGWVVSTVGTSMVSALLPVVNTELYLVGVRAANPGLSWLALGVAAALGQMVGKLLFYYSGRGGVRFGRRLRHKTDPCRSRRWAGWVDGFRRACTERPFAAAGTLFLSAVVGLPPFGVMAVVAGAAGMGHTRFLAIGFTGRAIRFCVISAVPSLIIYF